MIEFLKRGLGFGGKFEISLKENNGSKFRNVEAACLFE